MSEEKIGTVERVLDHVKCDEILESLRYMTYRVLPEPGWSNPEMRRIVPEVASWCLLEGLIEIDRYDYDHRGTCFRQLSTTKLGRQIVWKILARHQVFQLDVNVRHAYVTEENGQPLTSIHMKGYTPMIMRVFISDWKREVLVVQHPETKVLWEASIKDISFAKQSMIELKKLLKEMEDNVIPD